MYLGSLDYTILYILPYILIYAQIVVFAEKKHLWNIMYINGLCWKKHQILYIHFCVNLQLGSNISQQSASAQLHGPFLCVFQSMCTLLDVVSLGIRTGKGTVATVKDTVRAFSPLIMTLQTFTRCWPSMKKKATLKALASVLWGELLFVPGNNWWVFPFIPMTK